MTCADYLFEKTIEITETGVRIDSRIAIALGTGALVTYLMPTLDAGLSLDDAHRPYLSAFAHTFGIGAWGTLLADGRDAAGRTGGFFPLASLPSLLWLAAPAPFAMRALHIVAVGVNAVTFGALVVRITRSNGLALLALGCTAVALQLRSNSDAVIGPLFQGQLLVECGFIALLAATSYLRNGGKATFACVLLAGAGAALTGSAGYALCFCLTLVVGLDTAAPRRRRLSAFVIACVPVTCLALGGELHVGSPNTFARHVGGAQARQYVATALERIAVALPTGYRVSGQLVGEAIKASAADTRFARIPPPGKLGWLAVVAIAVCMLLGSAAVVRGNVITRSSAAVIGATLWLLPALAAEPVPARLAIDGSSAYLQAYGLGLTFALAVVALLDRLRRAEFRTTYVVAITSVSFLIAYGNVRCAAFVIAQTRAADFARELLGPAVGAGLFAGLTPGTTLVPRGFRGFEAGTNGVRDFRFAASAVSDKPFATVTEATLLSSSGFCRPTSSGCASRKIAFVVSARILPHTTGSLSALHWSGSNGTTLLSDRGSRFSRFARAGGRQEAIESAARTTGEGISVKSTSIGETSLLSSVERLCGSVDAAKAFDPASPRIAWGRGFYPPYPAVPFVASITLPPRLQRQEANSWGYAGASAHLLVTNADCRARSLEIVARVYTSAPARLDVRYLSNHYTYAASQDGVYLELPISQRASGSVDVALETDAPRGPDLYTGPRYPDARQYDIRMLVDEPVASVIAAR